MFGIFGAGTVTERPKVIYILIMLWLILSAIFIALGIYSLAVVIDVPSWSADVPDCDPDFKESFNRIIPIIHFGYLMATIIWFVFSSVFLVVAYGTLKKYHWVWTTGLILTTIFLVIFALMLTAFIINALRFFDEFSVLGLITIIISFITDLGLVFYLTRPNTKQYFEIS